MIDKLTDEKIHISCESRIILTSSAMLFTAGLFFEACKKRRNFVTIKKICPLITEQMSKEGIFMRFSYEFKRYCVELYRSGTYPETPDGISKECFRSKVRQWKQIEDALGADVLKLKYTQKVWTPEEKLKLVA